MTIAPNNSVGPYNVATALQLLGPADIGEHAPRGCFDHLVLMLKNIFIGMLRILNYVCGDHQWYDRHTAFLIIDQFNAESRLNPCQDPILIDRIACLAQALSCRSGGNVSFAEEIVPQSLQVVSCQENQERESVETGQYLLFDEIAHRMSGLVNEVDLNDAIGVQSKVSALCLAARRAALMNSRQANDFFQQAIDTANLLQESADKTLALSGVARHQLAIIPELALPTVDLIPHSHQRDEMFLAIVKGQIGNSVSASFSSAARIQTKETQARAMLEIAKAHVVIDPPLAQMLFRQAVDFASLCENAIRRAETLNHIAQTLANTDSEQAQVIFQKAADAAELSHNPIDKAKELLAIAQAQALTDPDQATQYTLQAVRAASLEERYIYDRILVMCEAAKFLGLTNSEESTGLFGQATKLANSKIDSQLDRTAIFSLIQKEKALLKLKTDPEQALANSREEMNMSDQLEVFLAVVKEQGKTDCEAANLTLGQALESANRIFDNERRAEAVYKVVKAQVSINPQQALVIAGGIQICSVKDRAYHKIALARALDDPEQALHAAHQVQDAFGKAFTLIKVAKKHVLSNSALSDDIFRQAREAARLCTSLDKLVELAAMLL